MQGLNYYLLQREQECYFSLQKIKVNYNYVSYCHVAVEGDEAPFPRRESLNF